MRNKTKKAEVKKLLKETAEREKKLINQWKEKVEHAKMWKTKHLNSNELFMHDIAKIVMK